MDHNSRNPWFMLHEVGHARLAAQKHFVKVRQLGRRTSNTRIANRKPASFDPLAIDELRRSETNFQVWISRSELRLDAPADFVVQPAVVVEPDPNGSQQRSQESPLEREPAGVNEIAKHGGCPCSFVPDP